MKELDFTPSDTQAAGDGFRIAATDATSKTSETLGTLAPIASACPLDEYFDGLLGQAKGMIGTNATNLAGRADTLGQNVHTTVNALVNADESGAGAVNSVAGGVSATDGAITT